MRYCEVGDCIPKSEEYGGICCKDCPKNDDCIYACGCCKEDSKCSYEIEN